MVVFEYLGVLVSVILGLGITHMLAGISKMIHDRDTVKIYWVQIVWTLNVLLLILAIWWGMFWWSTMEEWNFFQFAFIVIYAILLFLAAAMLYPWDVPSDFDYFAHYMRNRRWFFGILIIGWLIDIPETAFKAANGLRGMPAFYWIFVSSVISICLIAAISSNRKIQGVMAITYFIVTTLFLGFTTLAKIAS